MLHINRATNPRALNQHLVNAINSHCATIRNAGGMIGVWSLLDFQESEVGPLHETQTQAITAYNRLVLLSETYKQAGNLIRRRVPLFDY